MGNTAGSFFVRLGLDFSEYTKGLTKAEYEAQKFAKNLTQQNIIAGTAIGTQLGNAVVLAAKSFGQLIASVVTSASHLKDLNTQSGITVENLEGLRRVGLYSGTSLDEIVGASTRLNRTLQMTGDRTSGAGRALNALGLEAKAFKGLNADEQMLEVAKAMNKFEDGTGKSAAAMMLFRGNGAQFMKFLKELGERGIQSSSAMDSTARSAKEFEDNLVTLKMPLEDLKISLGNDIIPLIARLTTEFVLAKEATGSWWQAIVLATRTGSVYENLKETKNEVNELQLSLNRTLATKPTSETIGIFGTTQAQIDRDAADIRKNITAAEAKLARDEAAVVRYEKINSLLGGRGPTPPGTPRGNERLTGVNFADRPDKPAAVKVSEAEKYLEALNKQVEALTEMNAAEKLNFEIRQGIAGLTPALEAQMRGRVAEIEMIGEWKKLGEAEHAASVEADKATAAWWKGIEALTASNSALEDEVNMLGMDQLQREKLLATKIQMAIIDKEAEIARKREYEGYEGSILILEREVKLLRDRAILQGKKVDSLSSEANRNAENELKKTADAADKTIAEGIANGIMEGFQNGKSFADVFINLLKAEFAKTILTPMIQPIVAAGNAAINQLMGIILQGLSSGGGVGTNAAGDAAGVGMGPRSGGGPVGAGGMYRVNELRTEGLNLNGQQFLLMGDQGGNIDSNPRLSGGITINQTLNVGQGVSRSEVANAMVAAKESAKAEIMRSMRTNGAFARA